MSEFIPSPVFEEQIRKAIAPPEPRQPFIWHLRARLLSQANRMKTHTNPIVAWGVRAVVGILVVGALFLILTTPEVASAMRKLAGHIPGIDLTQKSTLRVLVEPVEVQREGITYTVKQGYGDTERTVLLVEVEGFTSVEENTADAGNTCQGTPGLRLLDNTSLQIADSSSHEQDTGYTQRLEFPPLPGELNDFILEVPCLLQVSPGAGLGGWVIPLHMEPASPDAVAPVIRLPPTPVAHQSLAEAGGGSSLNDDPAIANYYITFSLEDVVDLGDGYIFMCATRWEDERIVDSGVIPVYVTITDAGGTEMPYIEVAPDKIAQAGEKAIYTAYQIDGRMFNWPLTLSVETMQVGIKTDASFTFSPGLEISPGMSWQLSLNVPVSGYWLQITAAEAVYTDEYSAVSFSMYSDSDINGARLVDPEHTFLGSGDGGEAVFGEFLSSIQYESYPSGPLNLTISELILLQYGPWEVPWQP